MAEGHIFFHCANTPTMGHSTVRRAVLFGEGTTDRLVFLSPCPRTWSRMHSPSGFFLVCISFSLSFFCLVVDPSCFWIGIHCGLCASAVVSSSMDDIACRIVIVGLGGAFPLSPSCLGAVGHFGCPYYVHYVVHANCGSRLPDCFSPLGRCLGGHCCSRYVVRKEYGFHLSDCFCPLGRCFGVANHCYQRSLGNPKVPLVVWSLSYLTIDAVCLFHYCKASCEIFCGQVFPRM